MTPGFQLGQPFIRDPKQAPQNLGVVLAQRGRLIVVVGQRIAALYRKAGDGHRTGQRVVDDAHHVALGKMRVVEDLARCEHGPGRDAGRH